MIAVPPPYKAWLSISNDPDFTTLNVWQQLHQLLWEELRLPFEDSFFIVNHNETLPDQVNLQDHPEILSSHPHDTMHTWGDYQQTRITKFHRELAVEGLRRMRELDARPRIWTDHSGFEGNLIHRASNKTIPFSTDSSGHRYENFAYTLDLIKQAGVRYVWDGGVTRVVGQDRPVSRREHYSLSTKSKPKLLMRTVADCVGAPLWRVLQAKYFNYDRDKNQQYQICNFPDGQRMYQFRRHGIWKNADIDGLGRCLSSGFLNRLLQSQGTAIIYTHLGKPNASRQGDPVHVPPETNQALTNLSNRYADGEIMLSGTADLLDYLVLRDHAHITKDLDFRSDGIRFETLSPQDLAPFTFGVYSTHENFKVLCEGKPVDCEVRPEGHGAYRISFAGRATQNSIPAVPTAKS